MKQPPANPSPLQGLPPKVRTPNSAGVLQRWVNDASRAIGSPGGERVSWLLASTVVIAALQRVTSTSGDPLFLLKGGVYLEHSMGTAARATKDVDALFRGDVEALAEALDKAFTDPWGPLVLQRGEIEQIDAPRIVKPRRFTVLLTIKGVTFRKVHVEVAFSEGRAAEAAVKVPAPPLDYFGMPPAPDLAAITMTYQVAQKIHACTDPDTPEHRNDRVRDVADPLLTRDTFLPLPSQWGEVRSACEDVFAARLAEANQLAITPRAWPPAVAGNDIWAKDWPGIASAIGSTLTLEQAIAAVNDWIAAIADAT